jgi:hypothetical protein
MSVYTAASEQDVDEGYTELERLVAARVAAAAGPLFTTDADPAALWAAYLDGIPADRRQHYNCHCCRRFIQSFGGLVAVDDELDAVPVLWGASPVGVPAFFRTSVVSLYRLASAAKITGVFLDASPVWGTPVSVVNQGTRWSHLSGQPAAPFVDTATKSASQAAAERREDRGILGRSLADYPLAAVREAVRVLAPGALVRSEKAEGVAKWFLSVHEQTAGLHGRRRENALWRAAATAPPGYCHVRNTVLGTLLDDLKDGHSFATIARRWADKLHPLQYQRPSAAPTDGQIGAAERLVDALGVAPALARCFAKLADVQKVEWAPRPVPTPPAAAGVFGHLRKPAPGVAPVELPPVRVTWEKFARTVLPTVLEMEALVPAGRGNFYGLTTAADPDAPPIMQWDGLDGKPRNPCSVYVYQGGSLAAAWNMTAGAWARVTAVFLAPHLWHEPEKFDHHGKRVLFALVGAQDTGGDRCGLCLFPENLRGELRAARAVIEAHSRSGSIAGKEQGNANGLLFSDKTPDVTVRVLTAAGRAVYVLDRMD